MKRLKKSSIILIITIFIITSSNLFIEFFPVNNGITSSTFQKDGSKKLHSSNDNEKAVIVFFNSSTYDVTAVNRFEFYGGRLKENENWNGLFNNFSGFAGVIPTENITSFTDEFPGVNIEVDEIIEVQMNYASAQIQSVNSTWYTNGYNGNTGSSIAVLDSGVDPNHDFLQGRISGWQNFINTGPISDSNGHGTFISSVIAGTGSLHNNSITPSEVKLYGNYSHLDLFNEYLPPKNYTLKIFTANFSRGTSKVIINTTVNFDISEIDHFWIELYNNTDLVNLTSIQNPNQFHSIV
ncbi:MAG: S8 family serine peptidase, partial [Candidatus Hermodarchaeota archaeon]